ncbi:hypothetical protein ACEPAH_7844 [Sanghuangporus vaninii]
MFRHFQHGNAYFPAHCRPNLSAGRLARLYMKMTEEYSGRVVDEDEPRDASGDPAAPFEDYLDSSFLENLSGAGEDHSDTAEVLTDNSASLIDDSISSTDDSNVSSDDASTDDLASAVDDSSTSADETPACDQSNAIDDSSASESNNAPTSSASNTLDPNMLSFLRVLNSPVEASYWTDLGLATSSRARVYQISDDNHNGLGSPAPTFRIRGDLPLSELRVIENPFISLLSPLENVQEAEESEEEEIVPEEQACISPFAVSSCSDSTREDSPRSKTSSKELSNASNNALAHTPAPHEVPGPSGHCPVKIDLTPETPSPSRETFAEDLERATPQKEPTAPKSAPVDPSTSATDAVEESSTLRIPSSPVTSKKRKRVFKLHAATELRTLSTMPPERKLFSLPVREGRSSKTGNNKIRMIQVEAESCRRLAGDNGNCQFRLSENGEERCLVELPKDDKAARAHFAMHTDALGWREYSKQHPNWEPICPWCGEPRTKFEQLTRHILDTHLLMFAEWCPCGGTNSRANHKPHTVRHEDSDVHKAYLRQMAKGKARAVKQEDTGDEQEEFVQGSSKGTKRKRLR